MAATPKTLRLTAADVTALIDHSMLAPSLRPEEVLQGVEVAARLRTATACVRPCDVAATAARLAGTGVGVCTVIGFPHGTNVTAVKLAEAKQAMDDGATELDVVINVGRLRAGDDAYVADELVQLVAAANARGAIVKVILENAYLTEAEKIRAYRIVVRSGAAFLKTSTGFAPTGSTPADLRLMSSVAAAEGAADRVRVKAAGGIRTAAALLEAVACGATRIGCTGTEAVLAEFNAMAAAAGQDFVEVVVEPPAPLPADGAAELGPASATAAAY